MKTDDIALDREDIILLLMEANERLLRKSSLNGITRLVKLVFLLENESKFEGIASFFEFEPYKFGPFSKEVFEAVDFLVSCDLIHVEEKAYPSLYASSNEHKLMAEISEDEGDQIQAIEMRYSLTVNGRTVAKMIREAVERRNKNDMAELERIVRVYGSMQLNHLIRYVYRQYPKMTVRSIHPEAKNVVADS